MSALILVAEADPFDLQALSELCSTLGYDVVAVADGGAVLDAVARQRPDLVLMDAALPVMSGLQVLRILKADQELAHVPILLVTADGDDEARRRGFEMGAEDYVTKPYRSFEIQQRLRNVLRQRQRITLTSLTPGSLTPALPERFDIADPFTGAGTTSQLHISLEYEFTRAVRYRHPLSCVVVRCANYAQIASNMGGAAAQPVLVALAGVLRGCIRGVDQLFRSHPDEFTVLLPETDPRGCQIVVERIALEAVRGDLFDAQVHPRPDIVVASACYPTRDANDGEALWQNVRNALGRSAA
jgi:diguanylate cyclase (GGDEF)-like protein